MLRRANASEFTGIGIGLGASLGWAIYAIGTKLGRAQGFSASDLAIIRYAVPLVLIPFLLFGAALMWQRINLPRALALMLCVGLLFALANNTAFGTAPLSHGVVIGPGTTLITANLLLRVIDGHLIPITRAAGFIAVMIGIVIMTSEFVDQPSAFWQVLAAALLVVAGSMWGLFTYLVGRWQITAVPAIASVSLLSTLFFCPSILRFSDRPRAWTPSSGAGRSCFRGRSAACWRQCTSRWPWRGWIDAGQQYFRRWFHRSLSYFRFRSRARSQDWSPWSR